MFEAYTYEKLMEEVIDNAPEDIDTRQGSIFYDSVSGILLKIAKLYTDLDLMFNLVFIDTATGDFLDKKAFEYGIERRAATGCRYYVNFDGTVPEEGERFFNDGKYFTLKKTSGDAYYLEAEEAGTESNYVCKGTRATPVNNIQGLVSAVFGDIMEIGTNEESDSNLRTRMREKIGGPAENGNKQHYKTWCESVDGVGRARIIPLWNGPNTVKGIIINSFGLPADDSVIQRVQEYVDPDMDGDGEGDGLGEGVANLGAHFTAVSAESVEVNVSFYVTLISGAVLEDVRNQTKAAISEYFKELALKDGKNAVIRISYVGAVISGLDSVLDYSGLTLNGQTANIELNNEQVAFLKEVNINVL